MPLPPHSAPPVSPVFQEGYWTGGAAEKHFVFIQGNNLAARLAACKGIAPLTVAELGFGTGLTFVLAAAEAQAQNRPLRFISYELYPLAIEELATIHTQFPPELQSAAAALRHVYRPQRGWNIWQCGAITLHLYVGEAAQGLATQPYAADIWFLDGFSPAVNPELWTPELLAKVYAQTQAGGTATTYSAARMVKESLTAAGFTLERLAGFPPKKHMLKAVKA